MRDFFDDVKFFIEDHLITVAIAIVFIVFIVIGSIAIKMNREAWNDGVCPECGSHWVYKDHVTTTSGSRIITTHVKYIYECENCHKIIEQSVLR